jgi:hypothetical protein
MKTAVTFTTEHFKPVLSEESQVNPNTYGFELAWWLAQKLSEHGIYCSYPNHEDWGWFTEAAIKETEFRFCCSNVIETENQWHIFIEPIKKGLFGKPPNIPETLIKTFEKVVTENHSFRETTWE